MRKVTSSLVCLATLMTVGTFAAETDNFSTRGVNFIDVANILNAKSNAYLDEALTKLNATGTCDESLESEERLYDELTNYFSNHKKGALVRSILYTDEVPKTVTPLRESVYKEWTPRDGYLLGGRNAVNSPLAIFPAVQIGELRVGVDKLEHMFGMGLKYFQGHYLKGKDLKSVLKNGIFREKTALGGNILATGVFSYGDLAGNFNGMRFWNHVLQKRDDVLGKAYNVGPYVICSSGKWVKNVERPIDFKNYVDNTMNESVNCSRFATKDGLKKFQASLVRLNVINSPDEQGCPLNRSDLDEMIQKYNVPMPGDEDGSTIGHWIINEEGTGRVSYFNQF